MFFPLCPLCPMAQQPLVDQVPLLIEASRVHSVKHTTLGRTPLHEWSAPRRDLYLTTHNTHKRQASMPLAGLEPAIPARERPQTHALDCAVTGIGPLFVLAGRINTIFNLDITCLDSSPRQIHIVMPFLSDAGNSKTQSRACGEIRAIRYTKFWSCSGKSQPSIIAPLLGYGETWTFMFVYRWPVKKPEQGRGVNVLTKKFQELLTRWSVFFTHNGRIDEWVCWGVIGNVTVDLYLK